MDDNQKIQDLLKSLSGAVIDSIKVGTAEDRQRLIQTLQKMESGVPGVSEDAVHAKEFLLALVSLLEGSPVSPEALSGPYQKIYAKIVEMAVMPAQGAGKGQPEGTRELLTQLSAAAVLAMRKGTGEEKKALSAKLLEIREGISGDGARAFLSALSAMLGENPPDPSTLPAPYSGFFEKILAAAREKK